jgi:hypothetical protein
MPHHPLTALVLAPLLLATTAAGAESTAAAIKAAADSPFAIGGDGSNNHTAQTEAAWLPQMAAIGIHHQRTLDTPWWNCELKKGTWTWDDMDAQYAYCMGLGVAPGGILAGNPTWNAGDPQGSLPAHDIPEWSTYVGQVVKHFKGRVTWWEVWNEPPNFIGRDQGPVDYEKCVVGAYDAAKAADPGCKVGLAAKSVHLNFLEQVIKAGAKDHFDYITLHPYEVLGLTLDHPGSEPVFMNIVPMVRKMLRAIDPARADVPIWFTELGCDSGKGLDVQAGALVRAYTMGIAQGVGRIHWFEGRDGDSGPMGLLDAQGHPRPVYTAMATMITHFGQHPHYLGWLLLGDDYAFVFQGAEGPVLVTWGQAGGPATDFGAPVRLVDPCTGQITTASTHPRNKIPVIVLDVPVAMVAKARANAGIPLPWGGDYRQAQSVSVTMGAQNVERGLHTQSAASIAADVVTYGNSRSGTVPGGNVFMVDPNFLSYTPTPIEISALVRRDDKNDPASIQLEYESTSGYKKAESVAIPENKGTDWQTVTWKVSDDEFVSMWGYNFVFNAGSYYVKSVTVTKH